jgi:hypothetical protein
MPADYAQRRDPRTELLSNGRSMADVMSARGNGRLRGLVGAIVSPAGIDGRSVDFNPHDMQNVEIVVEPERAGGSKLTLAQFTKTAVNEAIGAAFTKTPGSDIDSVRERTAMAFEELAKIANSGVQKTSAAPANSTTKHEITKVNEPDLVEDKNYSSPDTVDRAYSPMAAFGLKKASAAQTNTSSDRRSLQSNRSVDPPNKLVYFEKEGIGTVPAFFHELIVNVDPDDDNLIENGFIILIYDLRFEQAVARWFPPANDPYKRPWALQINNDRRLYLVHTTGFQYVYDDREFCVLFVEKAVTAEA